MSSKNSNPKGTGRRILTIIITALVSVAVSFGAFYVLFLGDGKYIKLKQMDVFLNSFYGEADSEAIENGIISGYIDALDDKYAGYYTAEENDARSNRLDGNAVGIGVIVVPHPESGNIYVKHTYENCPADKAGIKDGDEIIAVDGVSVAERGYSKSVDDILREVGSTVELTVLRDGNEFKFTVEYSSFASQTVFSKMIGEYGYIEIISFNAESVAQFENAVNSLVVKGAKGLIFDLRGNGGGTVDSVTEMLDYLMPEGTLMTVEYGDGRRDVYATSDAEEIDLPMVVLTDGATASASELFSATIRDFNKGVLIGTKTYGKGVMQSTFGFTDGSAAVFTVAEFFPHSGKSFNGEGLFPDIEVTLNDEQIKNFNLLTDSEDPVKQAAVEWLSEQ